MGAHSAPSKSNTRRIAISGLLAGGAAIAGAGVAAAAPYQAELVNPVEGLPNAVTFDAPADLQVPAGFEDIVRISEATDAPAEQQYVEAAPTSKGQQILEAAQTKVGAPYVWGATGPDSFDCSGLTSWAYSQAGIDIPRTSQAQSSGGTQVAKGDLQPGDIVSFYGGATHVGIYAGDGQILHASTEGVPVGYAPLDSMPFNNAVRYY